LVVYEETLSEEAKRTEEENVRIPAFLILDKNGTIIKKHTGFEQGIVEKNLLQLLSAQ